MAREELLRELITLQREILSELKRIRSRLENDAPAGPAPAGPNDMQSELLKALMERNRDTAAADRRVAAKNPFRRT